MVWNIPEWLSNIVFILIGVGIGYQLALYKLNKVAWMDKWFDGPLDLGAGIKKYFRSVKSDLNEMKKG